MVPGEPHCAAAERGGAEDVAVSAGGGGEAVGEGVGGLRLVVRTEGQILPMR